MDSQALKASLAAHNAAFETLVDLISPKHYFGAEEWKSHRKTLQSKAELDPSAPSTVTQIQRAARLNGKPARPTPADGPQLSRPELQQKLKRRIAELSGPNGQAAPGDAQAPSPVSRDDLLDARRARRGELRDNRRKARKEARRKGVDRPRQATSRNGRDPSPAPAHPSAPPPQPVETAASSTGGDLSYSTLAFSDGLTTARQRKPGPSKLSKDPALATQALARRQEYLAKLKPDARERAEESAAWEKAGLHAAGRKVMDDPRRLAKALKRQEKSKQKKKDAWRDRTDAVRQGKDERQRKRTENIQKRRQIMATGKAKRPAGKHSRAKPGHKRPLKGF